MSVTAHPTNSIKVNLSKLKHVDLIEASSFLEIGVSYFSSSLLNHKVMAQNICSNVLIWCVQIFLMMVAQSFIWGGFSLLLHSLIFTINFFMITLVYTWLGELLRLLHILGNFCIGIIRGKYWHFLSSVEYKHIYVDYLLF